MDWFFNSYLLFYGFILNETWSYCKLKKISENCLIMLAVVKIKRVLMNQGDFHGAKEYGFDNCRCPTSV